MSSLISINAQRNSASLSAAEKARRGPVVDKFFVLGAIAALLGIGYLGSHLWMMRMGMMAVPLSFVQLRTLHAELQLLVFFGLFVGGFALQAGPRLFGTESTFSRFQALLAAILPLAGLALRAHSPDNNFSPYFYAASYLIVLYTVVGLVRSSGRTPPFVPFMAFGLLAFAAGAFLPIDQAPAALLVFWSSVGSIIIGVLQIFIANLLGGVRLSRPGLYLVGGCHALTILCLAALMLSGDSAWAAVAGIFAIGTLSFYFVLTRAWRSALNTDRPALRAATLSAFLWTLCAWGMLAASVVTPDEAFHLLATGFGFSLILSLSLHIVGHISGTDALSPATSCALVLLWQLVPLLRGLARPLSLPPESATFVGIVATVVIVVWLGALLHCEIRILKRQFQLRGNEVMVQD